MSSKDKIDTSSVEVEIDVEDTVVVSVADVVVGVCVLISVSLVPVVDCLSSGGNPELKEINYYSTGLSYGAIFSIIDGTNCSPKAVLACRSVNLVFISFSVQ
jgi:hypothetical protein